MLYLSCDLKTNTTLNRMRILKIIVSGFRKLKDNFTIDFISDKVPRKAMYDSELLNVLNGTYCNICNSIIGGNGQGKTSVLSLILMCYELLNKRRVIYNRLDFAKECIDLEIFASENNCLYNYRCFLYPSKEPSFEATYCEIERKYLRYKKIRKFHPTSFYSGCYYPLKKEKEFALEKNKTFHIMQSSSGEIILKIVKYYEHMNNDIFLNIFNIFEPAIESIKLSEDRIHFFIKINGKVKKISLSEMVNIMSFGTLKGVLLFMTAYFALKYGSVIIIDEIDSSINLQVVKNFLKMFINQKTNPHNATLYLSTHNHNILDLFHRNEGIFVVKKQEDGFIGIHTLNDYIGKNIRGCRSRCIERYEIESNRKYILNEHFIRCLRYK